MGKNAKTSAKSYRGAISIRGLSVTFENRQALKRISIDMPPCKLTSIIGPSGCGKTTLLRCLNRFIDFDASPKIDGEVIIDGQDVLSPATDVIALRKKVGMLSQKPTPLPMSIFENVTYGPKLHGTHGKKELEDLALEKLKMADLYDEVKDRLDAPASVLSIGQQQRLCLARTLSVEPEIILADEPTSSLDPIATERIEELLIRLKKKYTVVLATHNISQARRVSDYVAHLYFGELVEAGWAREVFESPEHPRTHAYIHGEAYVEHHIAATLDLTDRITGQSFIRAKKKLDAMKIGQALCLLFADRAKAGRVSTALKSDGVEIARVRRLRNGKWEMIVRKGN